MFIQGIQFLTTVSHELKFQTAEVLPYTSKKGENTEGILNCIQKVIKLYQPMGLKVEKVHGDNEFECIRENIMTVVLNISAADEHVNMVERAIRTIKDHTHNQIQYLPYTKCPKTMII